MVAVFPVVMGAALHETGLASELRIQLNPPAVTAWERSLCRGLR
ncbi:MAG: hypothetical protein ACRDJG_02450 [Actinomycetota bacterium]